MGRVIGKSFVPSCAQRSQGKSCLEVLYHLVNRGIKGRVIGKSFVPSCAHGSQGKSCWEEFCTILCTGVSREELLGRGLYHLVYRGLKGRVLDHLVHKGRNGKSCVPSCAQGSQGKSCWEEFCTILCTEVSREELMGRVLSHLVHRGLKGRVIGKSFVPYCAQGSQWEELLGRVLYHLVHRGLKGRVIGKSFVPYCAQGSQGKSYREEFCTILCTGVSREELLGRVLYHLVQRGLKGRVIGKSFILCTGVSREELVGRVLYHLVYRGLKGRVIGKSFVPSCAQGTQGKSYWEEFCTTLCTGVSREELLGRVVYHLVHRGLKGRVVGKSFVPYCASASAVDGLYCIHSWLSLITVACAL